MKMAIYKDNHKIKDGRSYYFKVYKKDFYGINKPYKSKRYLTKKEAEQEQALFFLKRDNPINKPFKLVAEDYFKNLSKIYKESTVSTYKNDYKNHIESFLQI